MIENNIHFKSNSNEWYTPSSVYDPLNKEFCFTLDPCCTKESAKCDKYFTKEDDGLMQDWSDDIVFVNPPYGREISKWVKKSYESSFLHGATVVMLIPARTDTTYWHDYIFDKAEIRFLRGRIKFKDKQGITRDSAPFPSAIIVFRGVKNDQTTTL
jgi:site-specific DNA-methyltransferase (adenine-specific)